MKRILSMTAVLILLSGLISCKKDDEPSSDSNKVATPTFSPAAGTYNSAQSVTITTATSGATIYYTTDDSTPTTGSTQYAAAINVSATTTIKAIAVKAGLTDSDVGTAIYTISGTWTTVFSDDFNRADGSLGSNYDIIDKGSNDLSIVSNEVTSAGGVVDGADYAVYKDSISDPNVKITAKVRGNVTNTPYYEIIARSTWDSNSLTDGYMGEFSFGMTIRKYVSGVKTELAYKDYSFTLSNSDTYLIELIVVGNKITAKIKNASGTLLDSLTATDDSISSGGKVGFVTGEIWDRTCFLDDFKVEKFE